MNNSIWNKRIPTLLGLFVLVMGVVMTSLLVKTGVITIGRASSTDVPQDVRITNITDTSFTVSYTTTSPSIGSVTYGKDTNYGNTAFDDRDQRSGNVTTPHKVHYISVRNVTPETEYFFTITSGENTYLHNNSPFQVQTGPIITGDPPQQNPVTGKVVLPDGTAPEEAIVYINGGSTQVMSTLVKQDGSYILPLNALRSVDLRSFVSIKGDQLLNALLVSPTQKSTIKLRANQINPIPLVTLSQNYDFAASQTAPVASPSAALDVDFPVFSTTIQSKTPRILTPKNDQGFTDQQPQFKGTAVPGSDVQITVHSSEVIQANVKTNSNGQWSFRPNQTLSPGEHTITIMTKDASGIVKTIKQSFTVYAEGTQVSQSATPSATLAPTLKPTATPIPTVIPTTFITATPLPSPTAIATPTTIINNPTVPPTKGGVQQPPPSPGSTSTIIIGLAALITTSIGGLLFFLSKTESTV